MAELQGYFPFWSKISEDQRLALQEAAKKRHYEKGEAIHRGSEDCIGLLLIISGQVRVYIMSDEGKELTLYRLLPRDMCLFSASCIIPSIQFDVMITAEQDSDVILIPSPVYKGIMESSAAVANYTNDLMASHFSDVMWLMDQILSKKLDSRLAAFLIEESDLAGETVLSITHEQIAGHLGSIREVITRMLKYFQSEGLVELGRGKIVLSDIKELQTLASESLR